MTAELRLHPACAVFSVLPDEELGELADDIAKRGLIDPITVMPDGSILDGRNRWLACKRANVPIRTTTYDGDDPVRFVISKNERRRHDPPVVRALHAAEFATLSLGANQHTTKTEGASTDASSPKPLSQNEAAELFDVSRPSVQRAALLRTEASPNVIDAVRAEKVGLSTAAQAVHGVPKSLQEAWSVDDIKEMGREPRNRESKPRRKAPKTPGKLTVERPDGNLELFRFLLRKCVVTVEDRLELQKRVTGTYNSLLVVAFQKALAEIGVILPFQRNGGMAHATFV